MGLKEKLDGEPVHGDGSDGKPRKGDIDKMHAYRDAIRDAAGDGVVQSAAILYPGPAVRYADGIEASRPSRGRSRRCWIGYAKSWGTRSRNDSDRLRATFRRTGWYNVAERMPTETSADRRPYAGLAQRLAVGVHRDRRGCSVPTPEALARIEIDAALAAARWAVQDAKAVNLHASRGVAVREFPLTLGHGVADYLLFADGRAVGVVEAKKRGETLTGVETQSAKYGAGLPAHVKAPVRPLPFLYESTGVETRFTNRLDPDPRSRPVFAFHQPATLAEWAAPSVVPLVAGAGIDGGGATLRARLRSLPPLAEAGLWPAQIQAVRNLEVSFAADRPRSLIQMATGSGKTFTAITSIYRLVKFGGAKST